MKIVGVVAGLMLCISSLIAQTVRKISYLIDKILESAFDQFFGIKND
jgi:hypothetical protein